MKYIYFVAYFSKSIEGDKIENCQLTRNSPITRMEDIKEVHAAIKDQYGANKVVVTNFILLRIEEAE